MGTLNQSPNLRREKLSVHDAPVVSVCESKNRCARDWIGILLNGRSLTDGKDSVAQGPGDCVGSR